MIFILDKETSLPLTIILIIYIILLKWNVPSKIKYIFNNVIFRIFIMFLIIANINVNPEFSLVLIIAYFMTLDYINLFGYKEAFHNIKLINKLR